jgi:hypothetical protein
MEPPQRAKAGAEGRKAEQQGAAPSEHQKKEGKSQGRRG